MKLNTDAEKKLWERYKQLIENPIAKDVSFELYKFFDEQAKISTKSCMYEYTKAITAEYNRISKAILKNLFKDLND